MKIARHQRDQRPPTERRTSYKRLAGGGHEILTWAIPWRATCPPLYIHDRPDVALAAEIFNLVDFVVGGWATGWATQFGMQYPRACSWRPTLLTPLDAFLFARINAVTAFRWR